MRIKEMEFNSVLATLKISVEDKNRYLTQCIDVQASLYSILEEVKNYREILSPSIDEGSNLLMISEEALSLDTSLIRDIRKKFIASTPSLRRRSISFCLCFDQLCEIINNNIEVFIPYTVEELNSLEMCLKQCCGHLACFILYQFGLNDVICDFNEDVEIFDVLDFYMRKNGLDFETTRIMAIHLKDVMREFNPSMGIFEMYPDLIEPFSDLVGEEIYDAEMLDLDTVMSVINGEMSVEKFQVLLEELYEKESLSE